jgi:predicted ABC-type exoprotein transport system permease subunit
MWESLRVFNQGRLVTRILSMDDAQYEAAFDNEFNTSKKLSDFIGMILRLSFTQFAWRYFFHVSPKTEGIMGFILGYCGIGAFLITLVLAFRIGLLTFLWQLGDARKAKSNFLRGIMFVVACAASLALYMGTMRMAQDIGKANALLGVG